jgi:hypothetical protein
MDISQVKISFEHDEAGKVLVVLHDGTRCVYLRSAGRDSQQVQLDVTALATRLGYAAARVPGPRKP